MVFTFINKFFLKLTEIMIIFLLSVFLQSFEILLCEGLLLDRHAGDTGGGLGGELAEEVQEGAGVDLAGHHGNVGVHHLDVGDRALV